MNCTTKIQSLSIVTEGNSKRKVMERAEWQVRYSVLTESTRPSLPCPHTRLTFHIRMLGLVIVICKSVSVLYLQVCGACTGQSAREARQAMRCAVKGRHGTAYAVKSWGNHASAAGRHRGNGPGTWPHGPIFSSSTRSESDKEPALDDTPKSHVCTLDTGCDCSAWFATRPFRPRAGFS